MTDISHYMSSFRKTSWDPMKGESLISDDSYPVYDFDGIAADICREWRMGENLSSCDGMIITDRIYLVEFKNQRMMNIDRKVLAKKAFDTLYLIQHALPDKKLTIEEIGKSCILYVVHAGSDSASFSGFRSKAASFADERHPVDFGLSKFRRLYNDVFTVGSCEFIADHMPRIYR